MKTYLFVLYCCQQAVIARDASQSKSSMEGSSSSSFPAASTSSLDSVEYLSSLGVIDSSSNQRWMDSSPLQRSNEESEDTPNHDDIEFTLDAQLNVESTRKPLDTPKDSLEVPTSKPSSSQVVTPAYLPSPTRRNIYIRGQRINAPDSSRSVGPRKTASRDFRNSPDGNQDSDLDVSNGGGNETFTNTTTKKRTVITNRRRFYNFKLLHDSLQGENDSRHGESQFYALLYGVGILLATSLVTLVVCLLLGICRQKIKARMDKRRRFDKSGEYERVDSVSSIVDSACSSQMEPYIDDAIEDVTII